MNGPDDRTLAFGAADPVPPAADPPVRRRSVARRALRALVNLLLFIAAGWTLTVAAVHLWGRRDESRKVDAIVVLGAAQYDGRPSPVLRARLDHAVALYHDGVAPRIIFTGGTAPGDTVSEAVVGRRYAARKGVPSDALLTEDGGMTSLESMREVKRIMMRGGMKSAVLVSDPFHMLRLKLLSLRLGMDGYTSPTRTSPISRSPGQERKHVIRESLSLPFVLLGQA